MLGKPAFSYSVIPKFSGLLGSLVRILLWPLGRVSQGACPPSHYRPLLSWASYNAAVMMSWATGPGSLAGGDTCCAGLCSFCPLGCHDHPFLPSGPTRIPNHRDLPVPSVLQRWAFPGPAGARPWSCCVDTKGDASSFYGGRYSRGFPGSASGKELTRQCRTLREVDSIPGLERSLDEGMAIHFSILAWRIPWTESLRRLSTAHWEGEILVQLKVLIPAHE